MHLPCMHVMQDIMQEIGQGSNMNSAYASSPRKSGEGDDVFASASKSGAGSAAARSDNSKSKNWFVQVRVLP